MEKVTICKIENASSDQYNKIWRKKMELGFKFDLREKNMRRRFYIVVPAVIAMGFALSFLLIVNWGADPFTMMNRAISHKIGWTIGNWQAFLNIVLLILVIIFGGKNVGWGTVANMFLVGYSIDFFTWIWNKYIDMSIFEIFWVKLAFFVPSMIIFIIAAAVYMDVDIGTSPYDAISFIITSHIKNASFVVVRIIYDFVVIGIGLLFGGSLGAATICMAVLLGPVVSLIGKKLQPLLDRD